MNRNGSPTKGGKTGSVLTTVFLPKSLLKEPLPVMGSPSAKPISTTLTTPVKTVTFIRVVPVKQTPQPLKSAIKAGTLAAVQTIPVIRSGPSPVKQSPTSTKV